MEPEEFYRNLKKMTARVRIVKGPGAALKFFVEHVQEIKIYFEEEGLLCNWRDESYGD